jgi:hypothetical protein
MDAGLDGFIDGLGRLGISVRREADLVVFEVTAPGGAHAGADVETGVSAEELVRWPQVPPHWVHLPSTIRLARTNSRPSSVAGWLRHSRNITAWGDAAEPAQAWVAHVRGVLEEAA